MNIKEISKHTVHYLETNEEVYTRHSANNWSVRIGESDEPVYNSETIAELEAAFQKWVGENERYKHSRKKNE